MTADVIDIDAERERPSFGNWTTEEESAAEFDRRIEECGLFDNMFKEVRGFYLAHRPNRQGKDARIDRVLIPGKRLREAGWSKDIGVELKRSGEKIGRPLAQAIDYTYCNFNVGVHWMMCEYIFLWPFPKQYRSLESVMLHNSVGVIYESKRDSLIFQLERIVIRASRDGGIDVAASAVGTKVGSR